MNDKLRIVERKPQSTRRNYKEHKKLRIKNYKLWSALTPDTLRYRAGVLMR